jgi:hypothetical protein
MWARKNRGRLVAGLPMCAIVHSADIQDRDGCVLVMSALFGQFPAFVQTLRA